jgi:hypothetical protein
MGGRPRIHLKIARADYDAFKAILAEDLEFPATYDLWYEHRQKELKDTLTSGDTVQEVQVDPQEFTEWCGRSGLNPSFYSLNGYAVAKAKIGGNP